MGHACSGMDKHIVRYTVSEPPPPPPPQPFWLKSGTFHPRIFPGLGVCLQLYVPSSEVQSVGARCWGARFGMFLLGGWFLWVCCSWSLEAPLLSEGRDGLAEPSVLSPIPYGTPNSMRVSSVIPATIGLTYTFQVSRSMMTSLLVSVAYGSWEALDARSATRYGAI